MRAVQAVRAVSAARTVRGIAVAVALSVATSAAVAGCGDDEGADPDLGANVQRSTLYELHHALRLAVTGDADHERHLSSLQLRSPLFEPEPPEDRDAVLRAGNAVVTMAIPYGEPRCDRSAGRRPDDAAVLVADVDGEEMRIPIEERPSDLLATLHERECAAAQVFADVELSFRGGWEHTEDRTVETDIQLAQRHGGVEATVDELEGNAVFSLAVEGDAQPVLEVSDDQPSSRVHVAVHAARCDPHGIIEYKRKYKFVAWVRIGGAEPVRVDLVAEGDDQHVLEDLLTECLG